MPYLKQLRFKDVDTSRWPFTIPALAGLEALDLSAPVTILCGENGSGKSTLLEALAVKLAAPAIGRTDAGRDDTLAALRPYARAMVTSFARRPRSTFFLRSEDFFNFVQTMQAQRRELREDLARVDEEYRDRDAFTRGQARMAYAGAIADMEGRYGDDLLDAASHGESFLRLFESRMHPGGLYLLDEPEAPLSPLRQLSLLSLIMELAREGDCQFLIATHSPILMACPHATIYSFDAAPLAPTTYDELESVTLLRSFLDQPERFISRL